MQQQQKTEVPLGQ